MLSIGKYDWKFPETPEEADVWKPEVRVIALGRRVLVVANTRQEGMWCAYCAAVTGMNHEHEFEEVRRHGDKLEEKLALAIFPSFEGVPYAK